MRKSRIVFILLMFLTVRVSAADYLITDFGAVRGKISTISVQRAVDKCYSDGGGRVIVPPGVFITGTIILKSNIDLHLEQGAELRSSINIEDFTVNNSHYGMIFCEDATNVSITGEGNINGMGSSFYDADKNHLYPDFDRKVTRQKDEYMKEGIFFTDGPIKRGQCPGMTIVFFHCNNLIFSDFRLTDTPLWAIRLGYCDDVVIERVSISNNPLIPNSDGIHLTVSRNVRISGCNISAGDDAIIVTGFTKTDDVPGFDSLEQKSHVHGNKSVYAENISVTNCTLKSRSSGIRVGYGQHPIRRCIFSNITIYDSHRGIGIFVRDSSSIEDLIFSDIIIETRLYNGQWWGNGEPIHLSAISRFSNKPVGQIRNVQFNNIIATGEQGILIYGIPESHISDISFNNVRLHLRKGIETMNYGGNFDLRPCAYIDRQIFEHDIAAVYAQYTDKLTFHDFTLTWGTQLPSFFTNCMECFEVNELKVENFEGTANPGSPGSLRFKFLNTRMTRNTNQISE